MSALCNLTECRHVHPQASINPSFASMLPFEFLPTHWTKALGGILLDPGHETMHVERVSAFTYEQRTVVSWVFTRRTSSVKLNPTDSTHFILRHVPSPCSHCVPFLDSDFHGAELAGDGVAHFDSDVVGKM